MDLLNKVDTPPLSVGEFLTLAQRAIEGHLPTRWITGEVSNFFCATSGHWYFTLRDGQAQVDCVMMARQNVLLQPALADGQAVEVMAQASLYAPRGRFQLRVRFVRRTGVGRLHLLFVQRKTAWAKLGWFNADTKQKLPAWPTTVGVVGSATGAAVRDVLRALRTRMPSIHVIVYPAPAQGVTAAEKIAEAIAEANRRNECQTLIVCRGGGGLEDLWAYNEESVVRAIVRSRLPVVSGIGHEIDETLADWAADVRASTPTAAAMLAAPDGGALREQWQAATRHFCRDGRRLLEQHAQKLDWAAAALSRPAIVPHLQNKLQMLIHKLRRPQLPAHQLADIAGRLPRAAMQHWQKDDFRVRRAAAVLSAHHPQKNLSRGYSIVKNAAGKIITDGGNMQAGDEIKVVFARGGASATVQQSHGSGKVN